MLKGQAIFRRRSIRRGVLDRTILTPPPATLRQSSELSTPETHPTLACQTLFDGPVGDPRIVSGGKRYGEACAIPPLFRPTPTSCSLTTRAKLKSDSNARPLLSNTFSLAMSGGPARVAPPISQLVLNNQCPPVSLSPPLPVGGSCRGQTFSSAARASPPSELAPHPSSQETYTPV